MTEYHDGMRVEKEENSASQTTETRDGLSADEARAWGFVDWIMTTPESELYKYGEDEAKEVVVSRLVTMQGDATADLLAILREALKEAEEALESGERNLDPRCCECTDDWQPPKYEDRPCWIHKARKLIGDAQ